MVRRVFLDCWFECAEVDNGTAYKEYHRLAKQAETEDAEEKNEDCRDARIFLFFTLCLFG